MQVIVKGRHTHVPNSIKEIATSKIEKVSRFLDSIQSAEIEFSEEHNPRIPEKHIVEVTLTTKSGVLRAHASGVDAASAVDRVVDKVEAQVRRMKSKFVERGSRTTRGISGTPGGSDESVSGLISRNGTSGPIESGEGQERDEEGRPRITRTKRFAVKPMTAEEAVLQMEALGHDFYLFVDAESEQAGVVYRRSDGSFGLIEPD